MVQPDEPINASVITTSLVVISVLFPVVSAISIYFRILACRRSKIGLSLDDYGIIVSWIFTLPLSVFVVVYAAKSGVNHYTVDFLTGTEASLELIFISSFYIQFPLATVKIAVLLFYRRIFATPVFRRIVSFVGVVVIIWCLLFFFLVLFELDRVKFPLTEAKLRFDGSALGIAQVASSFVLDVVVLCLPIPVVARLNMKRKRKIGIILVFWLGSFCTIAGIVRTILLEQSIREVVDSHLHSRVASQSTQYIFMILEPNCAIVAACLPTYGPLAAGRTPRSLIRKLFRLVGFESTNRKVSTEQSITKVQATYSSAGQTSTAKTSMQHRSLDDILLSWPGRVRLSSVTLSDCIPLSDTKLPHEGV